MKSRIKNWIKGHKKAGAIIATTVMALVLMGLMLPVFAATPLVYVDVTGTYDVTSAASPRYMDNARHTKVKFGTLVITTQTDKAISVATLQHMGTDIALTGLVGPGTRPNIALSGTDSDGTVVTIQARVRVDRDGTTVTSIGGRIIGYVTSDGSRWEDSADGTSAISTVAYHSEPISTLLTGGTLQNPETLTFHNPYNRLKLSNLTNLREGQLGFWFNFQVGESWGPQMMLRFAPADSTAQTYYGGATDALVDITVMPYQPAQVGTGTWLEIDLATWAHTNNVYYGRDPTDYTSFGGTPIATLAEVEAAINAEAAMTAGTDSASSWVLTMAVIELWEGGARTCYVDDVTLGGILYTGEPNSYYSGFRANKQ